MVSTFLEIVVFQRILEDCKMPVTFLRTWWAETLEYKNQLSRSKRPTPSILGYHRFGEILLHIAPEITSTRNDLTWVCSDPPPGATRNEFPKNPSKNSIQDHETVCANPHLALNSPLLHIAISELKWRTIWALKKSPPRTQDHPTRSLTSSMIIKTLTPSGISKLTVAHRFWDNVCSLSRLQFVWTLKLVDLCYPASYGGFVAFRCWDR